MYKQNLKYYYVAVQIYLWKITITLVLFGSSNLDPRLKDNNGVSASGTADECQVTPVIHILQQPGCIPKPIPSYACIGRCASYVQVNNGMRIFKCAQKLLQFAGIWQ